MLFSDVEGRSVDFEGSLKCSVHKIKFLFCFKKMFSRFATPLNIVQFEQAHWKFRKGEFRDYRKEMESSASISFMNSREIYSGSNKDSSDEIKLQF